MSAQRETPLLDGLAALSEQRDQLVSLRVTPTEKARVVAVVDYARSHGAPNATVADLLRMSFDRVLDEFESEMSR